MNEVKKNQEEMRREYSSPHFEIMEVTVEEGFAVSAGISGSANDFTTNSFGSGDGGSTMEF